MRKQIVRVLINILAFLAAAQYLPIEAATPLHFLGAGIVLSLINLLIRPIFILLTLPLNLLTLGVFTLIVNTWMIQFTSGLLPGFYVPGFWVAFLVSIIIYLVNWLVKKIDPSLVR